MSKMFMISKKIPFLCLLGIVLLLPAAEAKQKQKTVKKEPAGTVRIVTDIPNVKVFINGEAEGLAHPNRPLERDHIPAGEVRIHVRAENYPEMKEKIKLRSGQTKEVTFRFLPDSPEEQKEKSLESKKEGDRPASISDTLSTADKYFRLQRYMSPKGENAFEMYKSVLTAEPENAQAREKLYEMIEIYKKMGEDAGDKSMERSLSAYQNCLTLLTFAVENMKDGSRKKEAAALKKQVKEMETLIRKADQLAKEGDTHFIAQRYTTPKKKNAFSLYKAALEKNPTHERARKRILEMARFYKGRWDKARKSRNRANAEEYRQQYRLISAYVSANFKKQKVKSETEDADEDQDDRKPRESQERENLLRQAEDYMRKGQYAGTGEQNALFICQQILKDDPHNDRVLKKIREMMKTCQTKGMAAFEKEKYHEAGTWFDQYLIIAGYAADTRKIPVTESEIAEIRQLRADTGNHVRGKELETVREVLKKNYDQYRELRAKENEGAEVTQTIIPLMREIISNLTLIEQIYQDFPKKDQDIAEKTERVRNLRMEMERETAVREGKAY